MMRPILRLFLLFTFSLGWMGAANAANCNFGTNINRSFEIDRTVIEQCMLSGQDPPRAWIKQGGVSFDVGGHENSVGPVLPSRLKSSNGALPYYQGTGCGYVSGNTRPGGRSEGGASAACEAQGDGGQAYGVPAITFSLLGDITFNMLNCLSSFSASAKASGGLNKKMCLSGSAKFCGFKISGSKCASTKLAALGAGGVLQKPVQSINKFFATDITALAIGNQNPNKDDKMVIGYKGAFAMSGPTTMILPNGAVVALAAHDILIVDDDNVLHVYSAFGDDKGSYDLGAGGSAVVNVPTTNVAIKSIDGSVTYDANNNATLKPGTWVTLSQKTTLKLPGATLELDVGESVTVGTDNTVHIFDANGALVGNYPLGNYGFAVLSSVNNTSSIAAPVDPDPKEGGNITLDPALLDNNYENYNPNGTNDNNSSVDSVNPCIRQTSC